MRRALIGIMMGASLLAPAIAQAREPVPNAAVAQDQTVRTAREARQAARQENRAARQAQRATRPAAARPERRTERREQRQETREARREQRREVVRSAPAQSWPGQRERVNRVLDQREQAIRQERRGEARQERRADRRDERRDVRQDRREDRREIRRDRREDRAERRDDRRDVRQARREWNREWRQDRRYDWQRYRFANRNIFNMGRYYAPYRNHRYNRFSIGVTLGSGYYGNNYWINDPWQYRLPPAYPGTRWVRYYDDVLLVDLYNGRVIDVIYDFFW